MRWGGYVVIVVPPPPVNGGHGGPNQIGALFFCVSFSPVFPLLLGLLAPILGGRPCIGFESSASDFGGVLLSHMVVRVVRG